MHPVHPEEDRSELSASQLSFKNPDDYENETDVTQFSGNFSSEVIVLPAKASAMARKNSQKKSTIDQLPVDEENLRNASLQESVAHDDAFILLSASSHEDPTSTPSFTTIQNTQISTPQPDRKPLQNSWYKTKFSAKTPRNGWYKASEVLGGFSHEYLHKKREKVFLLTLKLGSFFLVAEFDNLT